MTKTDFEIIKQSIIDLIDLKIKMAVNSKNYQDILKFTLEKADLMRHISKYEPEK
jgi:hypothetical protein